jgi:anti-sigma B factor antagonist
VSAVEDPLLQLGLDLPEVEGFTFLALRGEFDAAAVARFRGQLTELMGAGRHQVAVDLGEVTFVDSTGLGALVAGMTELRMRGGDLVLVCIPERVLALLEITSLTKVFSLFESNGAVLRGREMRR